MKTCPVALKNEITYKIIFSNEAHRLIIITKWKMCTYILLEKYIINGWHRAPRYNIISPEPILLVT